MPGPEECKNEGRLGESCVQDRDGGPPPLETRVSDGRSLFPAVSCRNLTRSNDGGPSSTALLPHHPSHPPPSSFQVKAHHPPAIHHKLKDLSTGGAAQAPDSQLQPAHQASQAEVRGLHTQDGLELELPAK